MNEALAFDLEITNLLPDFVSWRQNRPLGISVVGFAGPEGTFSINAEAPNAFDKELAIDMTGALYTLWTQGVTIITFNGLAFDFAVLADASGMYDECREMALSDGHVDLMFNAYMHLGWNIGLNTACKETCGIQKSGFANGAEAPQAWHDGRHLEVIEYCKNDAEITLALYNALRLDLPLKWKTRSGKGKLRVLRGRRDWQPTWSVSRMLKKEPPPLASFMDKPITLKSFLDIWNE